jgi:D-alanine-D-alanine ligase
VVIKPSHLGSSIGICLANNEKEAKIGIEKAFELDDRIIIEKYLNNKVDVNCAACIIHGEICVSGVETAFGDGIYSFEEKYIKRRSDTPMCAVKGGGRYALNGELKDKIRSYTRTIYKRMNLQGVVRMDFLVSENKAYLCEVNTVPGSLAYYLFCERLTDAKRFFGDVLEEAVALHNAKKKAVVPLHFLQTVHAQKRK